MTIDKVPDCIGVMKFERVKDGDEKETKEVDMDDWSNIFAWFSISMSDIHIYAKISTWISISVYKADSGEGEGTNRWIWEVDPRICSVNIIYSFVVNIHPLCDTTIPDLRAMQFDLCVMFHPHQVSFMCICKIFCWKKYKYQNLMMFS